MSQDQYSAAVADVPGSDERCEITDLLRSSCGHCQQRPGAVDLHRPGGSSQPSGYAQEVVTTEFVDGLEYGLVPSGGTAYTFGSGHGLHHRRECSEGSATPPERVQELDDPNGDLWRAVLQPKSEQAAGRRPVNIDGRPLTAVCGVCALRPQYR